jgi:hypothetical protein
MTRLTLFKVSMDPGLRRESFLPMAGTTVQGLALLAIALAHEIG